MGVLTFDGVPRKAPSSISKPKAPTSLTGVAEALCQAQLFFIETMAILGIQPIVVFCLAWPHYVKMAGPEI